MDSATRSATSWMNSTSTGSKVRSASEPTSRTPIDAALDHQRHPDHRLHPPALEDGVADVGFVDVGDDDRLGLGGHPAREAVAHRDPHALADVVPDAARGGGDQVAGHRVEQQHGRRVDVEDLADAVQQLDEQVLHIEVHEGGIGDGVDASQPLVSVAPRPAMDTPRSVPSVYRVTVSSWPAGRRSRPPGLHPPRPWSHPSPDGGGRGRPRCRFGRGGRLGRLRRHGHRRPRLGRRRLRRQRRRHRVGERLLPARTTMVVDALHVSSDAGWAIPSGHGLNPPRQIFSSQRRGLRRVVHPARVILPRSRLA